MSHEQIGTVRISDETITAYAASAALDIKGVYELTGSLTDSISKNFLGKESSGKGVKLTRNEDGLILDVYIIVEYKVNIPQLAWEIQGTVKRDVEEMTELPVLEVNIHVQGVNLPGEENVR